MKLTNILFFVTFLNALGNVTYSQYARVSLDMKDVPIQAVLSNIEEQSEFFFLYSSKMIDVAQKVDIHAKSETITDVLDDLLSNTGISYSVKDRQILLINKDESPATLQQRKITGTVKDENGNPLPGVNIQVEGTTIGTMSDVNGVYTINIPNEDASILFSFIGYKSQKVVASGRASVDISLTPDVSVLNDVVVVAFGTTRKKDLTGSITSVDSKLIAAQSNSTLSHALEGAVPGLQVSSIDGQPGLDNGIRIRGLGTASQNNSNALVVIDGVPSSQSNALSIINPKDIESMTVLKDGASTALYGSRGANGVVMVTTKKGKSGKAKITYDAKVGINQKGPFDFEKISDPKDYYEYAWLSIYNAARFKSTDKYTTNVQNPNMSDTDAAIFASQHLFDYKGSTTDFQQNDLGNWMLYDVPGAIYTPTGSGSTASSTMTGAYLVNPDGKLNPNAKLLFHDPYDDYFLENKFRQEHNLSISGASEKIDYFLSGGYLHDPSYIRGSQFDRYNFRGNVNAQVTDWLKAGVNLAYAYRKTQSPATRYGRNPGSAVANVFYWMNAQNQLVPLYARDKDGNAILDANGDKVVHTTQGQSYSPLGPTSSPATTANLMYILDHDKDIRSSHDLNLRGYLEARFLKDFTFNVNMSTDNSFEMRTRYWNPVSGSATSYSGALGKTYTQIDNINTQQILNWSHDYDKHHFDATAGHEFNSYHTFNMSYKGSHSLVPDFDTYANFVGLNYGSTFSGTGGGEHKTALEGYFARANYIYNNKYYAQASIRTDGSSKFKFNENRWGVFWSLGGGWRISEEDFMSSAKSWLNDLKLRGSYGVIGNQNGIGNYSGYQTWGFSASAYSYSGASYYPSAYKLGKNAFVNDALTWERVNTTDLGLDFRVLDIVFGTLDYYNRRTPNAVWGQPIAYSLGQQALDKNNAEMRTRGIELELGVDIIKTQDINWTVSVNGTHYRTVILSVPEGTGNAALNGCWTASVDAWSASGGGSSQISFLRGVNKDYYNMYFYHYAGVDQNTGLPLFDATVTAADQAAGLFTDAKVGDVVQTTNYSAADKYEMGSATPDFIGGLNTTFRYKDFDVTANLAFQIGGKFLSVEYANGLYRSEQIGGVVSKELQGNTWTPENTGAKFPMQMYTGDQYGNGATIGSWAYSDMSLFDASYLSVKNITFGYTFSQPWLNKVHLSDVRLYASFDNMWMFTQHAGFDPRMSLAGGLEVGAYSYPYMRTQSLGITVTF